MPELDVIALGRERLETDELRAAMVAICDQPHLALRDPDHTTKPCAIQSAQPYWFTCPACKFDWREWLKPSIRFVSLSFVTSRCPNCRRKHVPACRLGSNYAFNEQIEVG